MLVLVGPPATASGLLDLTQTVAQTKPAVVGIMRFDTSRNLPAQLIGTGFAVLDGRHIITNAHVLSAAVPAKGAKVNFFALLPDASPGKDGRRKAPKRIRLALIDIAKTYDLALLKMSDDQPALMPLTIEPSPEFLPEGSPVLSIGFPIGGALGLYPAASTGIISAITPSKTPQMSASQLDAAFIRSARYALYQLDLTAYPGQSGSPLIHARTGRVIGVLNATRLKSAKERVLSDPSGISYAITAAELRTFLLRNGFKP